jgi:hypothetical protein
MLGSLGQSTEICTVLAEQDKIHYEIVLSYDEIKPTKCTFKVR